MPQDVKTQESRLLRCALPFFFCEIVNYSLLSNHKKGPFSGVAAFLRHCSQEMDSTLWKIAPATARDKPEQQPGTSMYGLLSSCQLVLSHQQALSGPHGKQQFAGSLKPARPLKLTKCLLDLLPNRLALFLR